jgi:hypothetical protein
MSPAFPTTKTHSQMTNEEVRRWDEEEQKCMVLVLVIRRWRLEEPAFRQYFCQVYALVLSLLFEVWVSVLTCETNQRVGGHAGLQLRNWRHWQE